MARVTVSVELRNADGEPVGAAEERARELLKVYGFSAVTVRAVRRGDRITLELSGTDGDVRKAVDLFRG